MKERPKDDATSSDFTAEDALAFFARNLDEKKWTYHHATVGPILHSGFNGDDALWHFSMFVPPLTIFKRDESGSKS